MAKYDNTIRSPYFYADDEAIFYDDTVRLTDRAYDLLHEVAIRLLHYWMLQRNNKGAQETLPWILDVGCGTGAEAMGILNRIPDSHLVCVDSSPAMLEQFRLKICRAYGNESADGRLILEVADFRDPSWLDRITPKSGSQGMRGGFDATVSVYALHHLAEEQKLRVYRDVAERLPRGSPFINADLFTFVSDWLAQLAQDEEEAWIRRQFDEVQHSCEWVAAQMGPARTRLRDAWLNHIRNENVPLPITGQGWNEAEIGIINTEESLLRMAGFTAVEVPARLYQSAVIVALK